jgi:cGMP-dependent protein kinase
MYARMARESILKTKTPIQLNDKELILNVLKNSFIFKELDDTELNILMACMFHCRVAEGQYVFKQGDVANTFFIIKSGTAEIHANERFIKTLESPKYFGETALLYNAPRNASIRAATELELFGMERQTFQKMIRQISNRSFESSFACLEKAAIFDSLTKEQKIQLTENVIVEKYAAGDTIIHQNATAHSFYLIKTGSVDCLKHGKVVAKLNEGATFGEQAMVEKGQRAVTVKAKNDVVLLALSSDVLEKILGETLQDLQNKNVLFWAVASEPHFAGLLAAQKERWFQQSKMVSFDGINILKRAGQPITRLYLVLEGQIKYGEKVFERGQFFRLDLVFPQINLAQTFEHDLVSKDGKISMIGMEDLKEILSEDFVKRESMLAAAKHPPSADSVNFQSVQNLQLTDLLYLKFLGEGQLGKVFLVADRNSRALYALKMVMKDDVAEFNLQEAVTNEKKTLMGMAHPQILKLFRTFSDEKSIYFLTNFIGGVEFFDLIRTIDFLNNTDARFYVGIMLLQLEYLHKNRICHRDLKPENLIVDEKGYLHLIDFGTAKTITNHRGRTQTIIGTPHYMAPEILTGKGYSFCVDIWSMGICMYELMTGMVPFGEDVLDPYDTYKIIIEGNLNFPKEFATLENEEAMALIRQLLDRVPESRLGGSFDKLKTHEWFEGFDWESLEKRTAVAPNILTGENVLSQSELNELFQRSRPMLQQIEVS